MPSLQLPLQPVYLLCKLILHSDCILFLTDNLHVNPLQQIIHSATSASACSTFWGYATFDFVFASAFITFL